MLFKVLLIVQLLVALAAMKNSRRFAALIVSLIAGVPLLCCPASHDWEQAVWMPCALVMIPFQIIASLEAFFAFGGKYPIPQRVSVGLGILAFAFALAFWSAPTGDAVEQVVQVVRYQRVGCLVFLLLAAAFYMSVKPKELLQTREGRHLIWMGLWMVTWTLPILFPLPETWASWFSQSWMYYARVTLLASWVPVAMLRFGSLPIQRVAPNGRFETQYARES